MVIFSLIISILLAWVFLDYKLGRFFHLKKVRKREFPMRNSHLTFFNTGQTLYNDLFAEIQEAKQHIHILFYIVKDDKISHTFLNLLKSKAQEGVEVRLLVDRIGSAIKRKTIRELRENGVMFHYAHIPKFPFIFYSINERNHRKITIIDGRTGYIGGFNIGKEYLGQDPKLGDWRDFHLKIEGEGVQDLQKQFLNDWYDETKEKLFDSPTYYPPLEKGDILHKFIPTDGAYLRHAFLHLIQNAKEELIIGSPYFVPGAELSKELINAVNRGVDVTIIVPMNADHPFVKEASFPYFKPLIQAGCTIYRYYYGFFHAKVIVMDRRICDIGTANFDNRSLNLNHEINCFIYDRDFIKKVRESLLKDFEMADKLTIEELDKRSLVQRGKEIISTLISRLL
jgi:cardiolipin synthase A/B